MNRSLQTYSPRVLSTSYDALANNIGCQSLDGDRLASWLPFSEVCVQADSAEEVFDQPAVNSFAYGPNVLNGNPPFLTRWQAWVGPTGIRYSKTGDIQAATSSAGALTGLYDTTKPTKLSLGFDGNGWMAIAIQKTATSIEIKRYVSDLGGISSSTFLGVSPALFYSGLLFAQNALYAPDLGCYYLKPAQRTAVFLRLASENFAIEHVFEDAIPVELDYLIEARQVGLKIVLYAKDIEGRDVEITTNDYSIETGPDESVLDVALDSGTLFRIGVLKEAAADESQLSVALLSGSVLLSAIIPEMDADKSTLKVGLFLAEYTG